LLASPSRNPQHHNAADVSLWLADKMLWTTFLPALMLSGMAEAAGRSIAHAGKRHVEHAAKRAKPAVAEAQHHQVVRRKDHGHKFLNKKTASKKQCTFEPRPKS
jgi:hypothetical protein